MSSDLEYGFGMKTLKTLIKEAGLNNPKLAKLVGCTPVEIWRLATYPAKGGRKITPAWAERIAEHLNVKPHELLFNYEDEAVSGAPRGNQETVPVMGNCQLNSWFNKDEVEPEEDSVVPRLPGQYWNYPQTAYRVLSNIKGFKTSADDYVVCVNYDLVRKGPINQDTVVVEITKDGLTERTLHGIMFENEKFRLAPIQIEFALNKPIKFTSIDLPPDATEVEIDGKHIKIIGLVIGRVNFY